MRSVSSRRCPLSARRELFASAPMGCGFRPWPGCIIVLWGWSAKPITIGCPRSLRLFPLPRSSRVWSGRQGFTCVHHNWPDLRRSAYGIPRFASGRSVSRLYTLGRLFDGLQTLRDRLVPRRLPSQSCRQLPNNVLLSGCRQPPFEMFSYAPLWRTTPHALTHRPPFGGARGLLGARTAQRPTLRPNGRVPPVSEC